MTALALAHVPERTAPRDYFEAYHLIEQTSRDRVFDRPKTERPKDCVGEKHDRQHEQRAPEGTCGAGLALCADGIPLNTVPTVMQSHPWFGLAFVLRVKTE